MRLISRAVLREAWPPFLIGFAAYTFLLLLRTIFLLTDLFVRRNATGGEVAWMVVLSIPWIVVLTIPMAFLLAVLVGVGRLASDSEIVAMASCGVSPAAVRRPLLWAAAGLAVAVFLVYDVVLPRSNELLIRSMSRLAATSVVNLVSPRTFRQPRPGVTLFFDRIGADGRSLEGIFLAVGEEGLATEPDQVIVARRGSLAVEEERLWLDLDFSTVHEFTPADPSRYRVSSNRTQRILFSSAIVPGAGTGEKGLRAQSLSELISSARQARKDSIPERYRLAWVEIHKKLAIPLACVAFALVGMPLAERSRRGGRGSSFALSLAILIGYYVLLSSGESWAASGDVSPGVAMWLPDASLVTLALLLFAVRALRPDRVRGLPFRRLRRPAASAEPSRRARPRTASFGGFLRFPAILDRYVLSRFFAALTLVLLSVLLVSAVVDYADQSDEILRNHPPSAAVSGYYRSFLLSIASQAAPFLVLVAALLALGAFSRHSEDTACRASGVSLYRLGAPIVVAALCGAVAAFWMSERILPEAARREARYRNVIRGKPPEFGLAASAERDWHFDASGRIWHWDEGPPGVSTLLLSPSVFELSPDFRLTRRTAGNQAHWEGSAWTFRPGWTRSFDGARETSYETFSEKVIPGDTPPVFRTESRPPGQMRYRELQRYARRLSRSGYPTDSLETALAERISRPLLLPLMALLALPFAFRIGRRGALAGIGLGLALGMGLLVVSELFSRLGAVGALPPLLAAWTPDVVFGTAAAFMLVKLRT
jgi:LPS export ABC transporter permease LptG/LPS export ABC transporter permease LptF